MAMSSSYFSAPYTNYFAGASSVYSSRDMDTTDDYSVAMLDMANGDFRDDYEESFTTRDFAWLYALSQDADDRIYDGEVSTRYFLQRKGKLTCDVIPLRATRIFVIITRSRSDRKSTRLNSSHPSISRMPSSA